MFSWVQPRVRWLVSRVRGDMVLDVGFLGSKGAPLAHRAIREGAPGRVVGFDIASEVLTWREPDSIVGDVRFLPFVWFCGSLCLCVICCGCTVWSCWR